MFEKFRDYMYYLLTAPFKRVSKHLNQWFILFSVLGEYFDDALDGINNAYDQTMLATCDPVMLPIHAMDRKLTKYPGEDDENFRKRIANYPEVCKLGGSVPGILLAVRSLGFENPELIPANVMTGRVFFTTDGSWNTDGSRLLEAGEIEDRWAEFYIVIKMSVDEQLPIATAILKQHVRRWKYTTSKDNYSFQWYLAVYQEHSVKNRVMYAWKTFFWDYRKTDGSWNTDGTILLDSDRSYYPVTIGFRYKGFGVFPHESLLGREEYHISVVSHQKAVRQLSDYLIRTFFWNYRKTDGSWNTDGTIQLGSDRREHPVRDEYRASVRHREYINQARMIKNHLYTLDGSWLLDGSRLLDAYESETIIGYDLHYTDGSWCTDGTILLDGIENQEVIR